MDDVDLLSASLRADAQDAQTFAEVFARRFEEALPDKTRVQRQRRSLLSREKLVSKVAIDIGADRYHLQVKDGSLETTRCPMSGGIALKSEALDVPDWIGALTAALGREAERSADAQQALQRMLD